MSTQPRVVSYTFVGTKIADYDLGKKLGQGTYGVVFKGSKNGGPSYAIKIMFNPRSFYEERDAQKLLSEYPRCSPYITCLYDYGTQIVEAEAKYDNNTKRKVRIAASYMVSELMDYDLSHYLKGYPDGLPDPVIFKAMLSLLDGLNQIFYMKASHRDIKPGNILIQGDTIFKLGDLGLLCLEQPKDSLETCTSISTLVYAAPEVAKYWRANSKIGFNQRSDIWSLGLVFYEMLYGFRPMQFMYEKLTEEGFIVMVKNIKQNDISFPRRREETVYSHVFKNVIAQMLRVDPMERASPKILIDYLKEEAGSCPMNKGIDRKFLYDFFTNNSPIVNNFLISNQVNIEIMELVELCELYQKFLLYIADNKVVPEKSIQVETYEDDIYETPFSPAPDDEDEVDYTQNCILGEDEIDRYLSEMILNVEGVSYNKRESDEELCDKINSISKDFQSVDSVANHTIIIIENIHNGAVSEVVDGGMKPKDITSQKVFSRKAEDLYHKVKEITSLSDRLSNPVIDYPMIKEQYIHVLQKLAYAEHEYNENSIKEIALYGRQKYLYEHFGLVFVDI